MLSLPPEIGHPAAKPNCISGGSPIHRFSGNISTRFGFSKNCGTLTLAGTKAMFI
jgi:hypothetical protein